MGVRNGVKLVRQGLRMSVVSKLSVKLTSKVKLGVAEDT